MSGRNGKPVEIALVGSLPLSLVGALESRFTVHHIHKEPDPLAKLQETGPRIRGAVGHGMAGLTKPYIELMPNLEVFTIHGVGLETTDMAACRERGIVVTTTPVYSMMLPIWPWRSHWLLAANCPALTVLCAKVTGRRAACLLDGN
jgi:lactate dehydrogenase-like 2-hydroxyacid dehydrogenase